MKRRQKGLTLVEVVVALAILGLMVISLIPGVSNFIKMRKRNREFTYLRWRAQSIIELEKSGTAFTDHNITIYDKNYRMDREIIPRGESQEIYLVFYSENGDELLELSTILP